METSRIARGALYITLQNIVAYIMPFIFYTAIARILTPEEVGKISLLAFTSSLFITITQLAIPIASTRYISENIGKGRADTAAAVAKTSFKLILLTTIPPLIIVLVGSSWLSYIFLGASDESYLLMVTFATSAVLNFTTLIGAYFLGLSMFAEVAAQNLINAVVGRTAAVALAWVGFRLSGVVTGYLLGALTCLIASTILLKGKLRYGGKHFPEGEILTYSYPVFINALISIIQGWADTIILYTLTTDFSLLGVYYLIIAGTGVITVLWTPITTTMFPTMSAQYGQAGPGAVSGAIRVSTRLINLLVIPASLCLAAVSQTAIRIAYGPQYLAGAIPFAFLTTIAVVPAYGALFGIALQAIGETRAIAKIGLISTAVDMVAIALLIQPLNVIGLALGRGAMLFSGLALSYKILKSSVKISIDLSSLKKSILASIMIAVPIALVDWSSTDRLSTVWRIGVEVMLFAVIGFVAARKLKLFEKNDFRLIRQAMPSPLQKLIDYTERLLL